MTPAEISRRYQTIMWSLIVLYGAFLLYQNSLLGTLYKSDSPMYQGCLSTTHILAVISIIVSIIGSLGKIGYGPGQDRNAEVFARTALPSVVSAVLVLDGLIISLSGGATDSPFTHFLVATCAISLIFAEKSRTRYLIFSVTVAAYLLTMWTFFPEVSRPVPTNAAEVLAEVQGRTPFKGRTAWAHFVCFFVSVLLASLAAWTLRLPPAESAKQGSQG